MPRPTRTAVASVALYGGIAALFCAPLFESPHGLGVHDWDQQLFYYGAVLKSAVEYGTPPFWNPWYCGGNVLWQNPQSALLSPVYPLAMLTSVSLAMKINIVLHYWVGLLGMHLLLRRAIGVSSRAVVAYLACVFVLSGAHALHLSEGHSTFLPVFYLPLHLFYGLRTVRTGSVKPALAAGGLLALMFYNGGVIVATMSIVAFGGFALLAAVGSRRWRPLIVVALLVAAGLAYAAPKLVPVARFVTSDRFSDERGDMDRSERQSTEMLAHVYLDRDQRHRPEFEEQLYNWHEYGNYTGVPFALLFLASLGWIALTRETNRRWFGVALGGTAVLLLGVSAGEFARFAPLSLASSLPFVSSFRAPSRYTIPFVLFAVATVAWVWCRLETDPLDRRIRNFVVLVCLLASADLLVANRGWFDGVFSGPPLKQTLRPFQGSDAITVDTESDPYDDNSPMFRALMNDRAFLNCYEPLQLLRTADGGRPLVFTSGNARVFETFFAPNRVEFTVLGGTEPSHVFLNQNYASGWRSTLGPIETDPPSNAPGARIDRDVGGRHAFSFVPDGLGMGALLLAVALAGSVWAWRQDLRF